MIISLFIKIYLHWKEIIRLNRNKKVFKEKEFIAFNKNNLKNWMNLTKKERYNLSKRDSDSYMNRRKVLLEEIRKEYKRISKNSSKKT